MPKKILMIDDDEAILELYKTRLISCGYEVVTASDGNAGIEMVKAEKPDLIIFDVLMPGMSGYEFFQAFKKAEDVSQIPVIVVSARQSMRDFFPNWEIQAFLVKPFEPQDLMKAIAGALKEDREADSAALAEPAARRQPAEASASTAAKAEAKPASAPAATKAEAKPAAPAAASFQPSAGPAGAKKMTGKRILMTGIEEYVINKAKAALEAQGISVTVSWEENKAIETAVKELPNHIFAQYWEDFDKFDVVKFLDHVKKTPELKGIDLCTFCTDRNGLEASKTIAKNIPLLLYHDSAELAKEISSYLSGKSS